MYKSILFVICLIFFVSSCMHNKIRYIKDDKEPIGKISEYENSAPAYLVKKQDILYIRVLSSNEEVNKLFNEISNSSSTMTSSQGTNPYYLTGYTVNDSGNITLPIIGEVKAEGKKISEIRETLNSKVAERINNADVNVYLVSFYLTFLGEFNSQGKKMVMQDQINLLDALALAGGIADYGNKKRLLLLRKTEQGTKTFRIDATDRGLLVSDNYFLRPDDIIIAEPLRNKSFQMGVRDYTLVLTTITSTMTMVLLVINLWK